MAERQGIGHAAGAVRVSNYPATLTVHLRSLMPRFRYGRTYTGGEKPKSTLRLCETFFEEVSLR